MKKLCILLQMNLWTYPSFFRDSKHLINILKDTPINDSTLFVTIDVESLYTNLGQQDVISTTRKTLNLKSDLRREQKDFLVEALNLVMLNNYFWHEGTHYNQIRGVAMGAKHAPSVANILMSQWEETSIFAKALPNISLFVIILWDGTEENVSAFFT